MSFQAAALALAWVAILLLGLAMSGLMRQLHALQVHGVTLSSRVGLPPGSPAPGWFHEIAGDGEARSTLLLFADPGCDSCELILPQVASFSAASAGHVNVLVVTRDGSPAEWRASNLRILRRPEAFSDFRIPFVPAAVAVSMEGTVIGTEAVGSPDRLASFLAKSIGSPRTQGIGR